jgi:hypothetical protein
MTLLKNAQWSELTEFLTSRIQPSESLAETLILGEDERFSIAK